MIIKENQALPKPVLLLIAAIGWTLVIYLAWIVGRDSYERTFFAVGSLSGAEGLPGDPFNQRYIDHPWLTLMHTIPGMLFAVLGPMQFMSPIRDNFRVVHRTCGKIFIGVASFSGVSAVLLGFAMPVWGYTHNRAITLLMGLFMLFALFQAYSAIRARRVAMHREWMIRAFATGFTVAWFRLVLDNVLIPNGFDFTAAWNVVMATSAPVVLLAAEFWIRVTRPKVARRVEAAAV